MRDDRLVRTHLSCWPLRMGFDFQHRGPAGRATCCILFGTEAAVSPNHLLQDVGGALGPDERLGFGVVVGDALVDDGNQFPHAGKHPPAQPIDRGLFPSLA